MGRASSLAVGCLVTFGLLACSNDDADGRERAEVTTSSTTTTTASTTTDLDPP